MSEVTLYRTYFRQVCAQYADAIDAAGRDIRPSSTNAGRDTRRSGTEAGRDKEYAGTGLGRDTGYPGTGAGHDTGAGHRVVSSPGAAAGRDGGRDGEDELLGRCALTRDVTGRNNGRDSRDEGRDEDVAPAGCGFTLFAARGASGPLPVICHVHISTSRESSLLTTYRSKSSLSSR